MENLRNILLCVAMAVLLTTMGACSKEPMTGAGDAAPDMQSLTSDVKEDSVATADTGDQSGTPDIEFTALEYDFGEVDQGDTVEHVFKFKNVGDADLVIDRVKSS